VRDSHGAATHGRRTKKLIVAFHFQFANQAAWRCDECRKKGLEGNRRCGWIPGSQRGRNKVVWARKGVSLNECPVSYISPLSQALMEEYQIWRIEGHREIRSLEARKAEAFVLLETEMSKERGNGGSQSG
jgi:hypothetical protein